MKKWIMVVCLAMMAWGCKKNNKSTPLMQVVSYDSALSAMHLALGAKYYSTSVTLEIADDKLLPDWPVYDTDTVIFNSNNTITEKEKLSGLSITYTLPPVDTSWIISSQARGLVKYTKLNDTLNGFLMHDILVTGTCQLYNDHGVDSVIQIQVPPSGVEFHLSN